MVLWRPAAAAAKSLQSCPTLCDPIDSSPPGSPVPGILQARTLEWVARNIWSNRQIWPWSTNEAGQRLIEFCQVNALVIANTLFQQHKRRLYTWTSPDGQYLNQIEYIICSQRWRSSIQSAKTRRGADCGSDHKLLIAKFRLKLRKWRKPLDHSGMM